MNLVAHDLKNPLSSVLFASDLLLDESRRPERIPHYLTIIYESVHDALGYIRQYLETSSGAAQPRADVSAGLAGTLEWLLRRYAMQLEARGIRVLAAPPPAEVRVAIDERVLRQVAENLITNALKYAPDCELTLAGRRGGPGYWQLIVADRGPGIPPASSANCSSRSLACTTATTGSPTAWGWPWQNRSSSRPAASSGTRNAMAAARSS